MKNILVTGGAGYIGSHTLRALRQNGYSAICFDNLSTGYRELAGDFSLTVGDLTRAADVEQVFSGNHIDAVIHFASLALVEESCRNPFKYYHQNILGCLNLLESMRRHEVPFIVFSSTCATYGIPGRVPMDENLPLNPINPYGASKMVIERILRDYDSCHGLRHVSLRYFNAAGAHPDGTIGERHVPETHLIPKLFDVALDSARAAEVYGNDYPTPDGTCVRDYIHVCDLAEAHLEALRHLQGGGDSDIFNLGTGIGGSVLEVIRQVQRTTGSEFHVEFKARRAGDPPALVADPSKANRTLRWKARHSSLEEIVQTAWRWHSTGASRLFGKE
jgi:UDP-arabinose 4-epimerase